MLHPEKISIFPVEDNGKVKQTNGIKIALPLRDSIDMRGKTITADAILSQRSFTTFLIERRWAHYPFTAKRN